ncbi:MAG TPA: class F sortase [Chloroflexota bacterium]|jgi:LPXTG-site transpeptidase (sortase) family protein|nr:class F sortase [Chloroflexota bacterium]
MRHLLTLAGALVFSLGLAGLVALGFGPRHAIQLEATRLAMRAGLLTVPPPQIFSPLSAEEVRALTQTSTPIVPATPEKAVASADEPPRRLRVPSIRLDSEVVPARLVRLGAAGGAVTWEVPAHRVGHAQGTSGVGGPGNAVLLGHVSSVNAGNVFAQLDRLKVGEEIVVEGERVYTYRVSDVQRVTRDDLSVMATSDEATITLMTCTGSWLPDALDYSHRLIVRAHLAS